MHKGYRILPSKDGFGCDIIEIESQLSFTAGTETLVASIKKSHALHAIYFTKRDEIDTLITELTGAIRIAKDCCDNPKTSEQLSEAIEKATKFRESVNKSNNNLILTL